MKVLRENGFVKEIDCAGCKSRLGVEVGDIRHSVVADYLGDTDEYFTCACPVCGAKNYLSDLPYPLRDALRRAK